MQSNPMRHIIERKADLCLHNSLSFFIFPLDNIYPHRYERRGKMKSFIEKWEVLLEFGGTKKDITLLVLGGIALLLDICHIDILPFDAAWVAIILCGLSIISEAIIGLITEREASISAVHADCLP